jgi:hypothetical protein
MSSALNQQNTVLCSTTSLVAPGRRQPITAAFMVLHRVLVASSTLSTIVAFVIDGIYPFFAYTVSPNFNFLWAS